MLDQLVESKNNSKESVRMLEFLTTVAIIAVVAILSGWTYSLFAKDYGMGAGDLELSTLVAPPPPDEEPPPKPEKQPEKAKAPDADTRKELILAMDMSPKIPDKISNEKQTIPPIRKDYNVKLGDSDSNATQAAAPGQARQVTESAPGGLASSTGTGQTGGDTDAPPPPPKATPKPAPKTVSGGVLNGKATSLPAPPYPAAAKAVRASGSVSVQVLIDESGRVVSASAVSGHPLLRQAAESAARGARFSPTLLSGQPVKVSGVITYNFNL
ncbi:MAG: energy transducer TonB [Acidobacteriota bacterium]